MMPAAARLRAGLYRAGFWGLLLAVAAGSLMPAAQLPTASWLWNDRILHAAAYGSLALLGIAAHPRRFLLVAGGLFALGAGLEGIQAMLPSRGSSATDIAANGAGIACALLLSRLASGAGGVWPGRLRRRRNGL